LADLFQQQISSQLRVTGDAGLSTDVSRGISNTTAALASGVANQLLLLPIVSPASGVIYGEDSSTGVLTKRRRGLGPVFAERAETIGRGKLFIGFGYQRYNFDSLGVRQQTFQQATNDILNNNGREITTNKTSIKLKDLRFLFQRQNAIGGTTPTGGPIGTCPCVDIATGGNTSTGWNNQPLIDTTAPTEIITTQNSVFFTYGLTRWFDASVVLPMVSTSLNSSGTGTLRNVLPPPVQFQAGNPTTSPFAFNSSATGIGDITIRLKAAVPNTGDTGIAFAVDIRTPTGDERDFRGAGAAGIKPFVIASRTFGPITPHANVGYQFNGKSVLAGDLQTGAKGSLPDQFFYAVGADIDVRNRFTVAFDVLGQTLYDAQVAHLVTDFQVANGTVRTNYLSFWQLANPTERYIEDIKIVNGSVGIKTILVGNLMATVNVLFKLNKDGLRAKAAPMFGLSYTF
jgi:hypothetical protein